jgi:acyl-CoA dehydrogenase
VSWRRSTPRGRSSRRARIGVGRAALDFVQDTLKEQGIEIRYGLPPHRLTVLERDVMDMEAQLQAARLLTWRAAG